MKFVFTALLICAVSAFGEISYQDLFVVGKGGYSAYRIPAIIAAPDGSLLAFCEGRRDGRGDAGKIDMLLKRSTDGGGTWSEQTVVWADGENTCGNPCPVVDTATGRIILFSTWNLGTDHEKEIIAGTSKNTRRVFYLTSDDNGVTWSQPVEVTAQTKQSSWGWYATGPGIGIQLQHGANKGRLVIPANHSYNYEGSILGAHVIYSDDGGKSWNISEPVFPGQNESQVVELMDGTLMLNSRNHLNRGSRAIAFSADGGKSWPNPSSKSDLIEPRCQASIIRYAPNQVTNENIILFSNPNSTDKRVGMTVKLSYDEGKSWPIARMLYSGPSAYSCLVALPDGRIGCFYEAGVSSSYEKLVFAAFTLDWLTGTKNQPQESGL